MRGRSEPDGRISPLLVASPVWYAFSPETTEGRIVADWDEHRAAEIDWERFRTEKLYRALQTERGLPGQLPVGWQIDVARFRADADYRQMIRVRGVQFSDEREAELRSMAAERRRQRRGSPDDVYDDTPSRVVRIDDPRFRVRRPVAFAAPRR